MPLLANRLHVLNQILKKTKKSNEEGPIYEYIVPETREICSSEEELKRKKTIYESKIWTCRVSGRANLTHKEALKSELSANAILKKSIGDYYRSSILQIAHQSTSPLEPLVHTCWTKIHEQFVVGEPILLKVDANKPIRATVLDVDVSSEETEVIDLSKDETSSPNNSDKENSVTVKRPSTIQKKFSYSVKLISDDPVIVNHVPASCIQRVHRAPPKDHIRMLIRAYAMRYGPCSSGPWIVDVTAIRKYCPSLKMANNLVDKNKLRQVSENYELKFYEKIMNERNKGNILNTESTVKLSPKSLKEFKNFSVLRNDNPQTPAVNEPPAKIVHNNESKPSKKMKQATLQFGASSECHDRGRKGKSGTPSKSEVPLPPIARTLISNLKSNSEGNQVKVIVTRCASILTDGQIRSLPIDAQKLVMQKKICIENRKKLQSMTPEEQKSYLRDLRIQRRTLIDENAPFNETGVDVLPLPNPRTYPIPSAISSLQFGRILSFTEFLTCYLPLLTEYTLAPGELFYPGRERQLALDIYQTVNEDEEEFQTDDEEESALTSTDAGLPKASIKGLRQLSLDRILSAIGQKQMSAAAFRCLTRPMSALLRLVLLNDEFSKQNELGIQLSKIPITPYIAPELLRIMLGHELANGAYSTNDRTFARIQKLASCNGVGNITPPQDALGAASLFERLSSDDLFALDSEHRILTIEILVEWMLDFDTMDDYMHTCSQKASEALRARMKLSRQKRTALPNSDTEEKVVVNHEFETDDLASIVKSRRVLAAKAAEKREIREASERKRRQLEAKIDAEERALAKAEQELATTSIQSKLALRAKTLGTDRFDRRYWRFVCSPHRLFVEANWGPEEYHVGDESTKEPSVVASFPPSHLFPDAFANHDAARLFGFAAGSQWYVFDQSDELDSLVGALVERGARESILKKNLTQSGTLDSVKELLALTTAEEQRRNALSNESKVDLPRSADEVAIDKITAKVRGDARAILANVLLKNLYETEIHLRDGGLGGVSDFSGWQSKILDLQTKYGPCLSLPWSVPSTPVKERLDMTVTVSSSSRSLIQSLADLLIAVGQQVQRRFLNVPKLKTWSQSSNGFVDKPDSRGGGGDDCAESSHEDNEPADANSKEGDTGPHLVTTTELDKIRIHESDVEVWIDAWAQAVRSSSTLARLNFLHACLDACILWEKSVANVRCHICRRNKDDESLLLCDGCNSGFHLYCLRPPLHTIPRGDWFCVSCKPPTAFNLSKTTNRQRRNRRRTLEEEESCSGSSNSSEESSEEEGDASSVVEQASGRGRLQLRPSASSSNLTRNDAVCLICDDEATEEEELIGCTTCPNAFHPNCHNPALRSAYRRASWVCSTCRFSRTASGSLSAMGQTLKLRESSRVSRKKSFLRINRISTTPKKRPRPISDSESSVDGSESDNATDEQADFEGNTTVAADNSSSPPSKRPRISAQFSCADLIAAARRHRSSWPFQAPVDVNEVPDYYEIVIEPVDLSMINRQLLDGRYNGADGPQILANDFAKMFFNAELYNCEDSDIWKAGAQFEVYVHSLFQKLSTPVDYKRKKLN